VRRLERICKNVEVETDLIAELLELSRIKTRRHKMETVDLNGLTGGAGRSVRTGPGDAPGSACGWTARSPVSTASGRASARSSRT